jgi:hypothetical protein
MISSWDSTYQCKYAVRQRRISPSKSPHREGKIQREAIYRRAEGANNRAAFYSKQRGSATPYIAAGAPQDIDWIGYELAVVQLFVQLQAMSCVREVAQET